MSIRPVPLAPASSGPVFNFLRREATLPTPVKPSTVAEWRDGHERFWHSEEMRNFLGDPFFNVNEDTMMVLERFSLIKIL